MTTDVAAPGWVTIASGAAPDRAVDRPLSLRRLVIQLLTAGLAVGLVVALAGAAISRRIAANQAVHDTAQITDLLAESVIQPSLTNQAATSTAAAGKDLNALVRARVLSSTLVRVKIWSTQGTILYSDEPRLVGMRFDLDDGARTAFSDPQTRAEITDLDEPENVYERSQGKLLEVYRPVWTPDGHELLFESYFRYTVVTERSSELWRAFAGIILSVVAVIFLLLVPIVWTLLRRARRSQQQRERLIQRALDASGDERQRIAAALHDGIVQELTAASFAVAGGAQAAANRGEPDLARQLGDAAHTVRTSMGGLRSLVVDIYPPTLHSAGLPAALRDMAATIAGRGPAVQLAVDGGADAQLSPEQQQAIFRVAQESLRNTVKHAQATQAAITVSTDDDGVDLQISDDGTGFDPSVRPVNHLGLSLMTDVANQVGATLRVRTAPGQGTSWWMRVPTR